MRKALVFLLMILMNLPAISGTGADSADKKSDVSNQSEKQLKQQESIKKKVELFGLGAKVKVVMRGSSANASYEGVIDEISGESFRLKMKNQSTTYQYAQIESMSYPRGKYKTGKQVDPAQVRGIAVEIGIGEKATIDIVSSKQRVKGTILSIEKENLVTDFQGNQLPIKFNDVKLIERAHLPV
jgi:ribosome maturation factor RimP